MRFSFVTLALSLLPSYGASWGDTGHRTVAYIAEKCLSPSAHQYLDQILQNDKGYDWSDAATWADAIKRGPHAREYTKMWHYMG